MIEMVPSWAFAAQISLPFGATSKPSAPLPTASPTVADVPYYYSDFTPIAAPEVAPIITYDWRSPVIFDLP